MEKDKHISKRAREIYPLVFTCVRDEEAQFFFDFLLDDIQNLLLKQKSTNVNEDVTLGRLSPLDLQNLIAVGYSSMGNLASPSLCMKIVKLLIKTALNSDTVICRQAGYEAFIQQIRILEDSQRQAMLWISLPFGGDPNQGVSNVFLGVIKKIPDRLVTLREKIVPSTTDEYVIQPFDCMELLMTTARNYNVEVGCLNPLVSVKKSIDTPPKPKLSMQEYLEFAQDFVKSNTGVLNDKWSGEIFYHLQELIKKSPVKVI